MAMIENDSIGGGYGGFGGYGGGSWGGIAPVGLFGIVGADGLGGRGRGCDDHNGTRDAIAFDLTNKNIDNVGNAVDRNAILSAIEAGHEKVRNRVDHFETRLGAFEIASLRDFGDVKAGLKDIAFQSALNTKDIISSQKDCCCETKMTIMEQGALTRALIEQLDKQNLRDELGQSRDKNMVLANKLDNCQQTAELTELRHLVQKQGDTVQNIGSTFNTVLTSLLSGNKA